MASLRYFTGKPCKRGHIAERHISNRNCVVCERAKADAYQSKPSYCLWRAMIRRCTSPGSYGYSKYGAKGVTVCDRWRLFKNFIEDMGQRPEGMSLDRIDNAKGYSPENCRWATAITQANNKTTTRFGIVNGEKITMANAARKYGIDSSTARQRIDRLGWTWDQAFSLPASPSPKVGVHRCTAKTHCLRGHPLAGDNLIIRNRGSRECRTCVREKDRLYRERKKAGL